MQYQLCVMGNPIEHSKSPWIHGEFAKQFNLDISYIKIKPALDKFKQAVAEFKNNGGHGLNVTIPFKQEAFELSTELSERAQIAKAVNTIILRDNDIIFGDNTDGIGLINDITVNLNYSLTDKRILILGAGGAVRGILHPLLLQNPSQIIIVNRTPEHARQLANKFSRYGNIVHYDFTLLENLAVDVVIDGTGFDAAINLPNSLSLNSNSLCYDLKYDLEKPTSLVAWANTKAASIVSDGFGMLVEQAAEAFYLWTGKKPNTQLVIKKQNKSQI